MTDLEGMIRNLPTPAAGYPRRPALRWHGGKWILAPWVIKHFGPHRIYVEPFGGAASVLLRKPRSYGEIYNDLDMEVTNFFRVLRDMQQAQNLIETLRLTPFSREEFELAYADTEDHIERARRLVTRSFMGFGSDGHNRAVKTGFRANSNRSGTTPAHDWSNYPDHLAAIVERFQGVVIENRDACVVMRHQDGPETLHYVDPPYLPDTRSDKSRKDGGKYHAYTHELTIEDHLDLLMCLRELEGAVILSGYPSELYDDWLRGWHRIERESLADGARKRIEVLWMNERAKQGIPA